MACEVSKMINGILKALKPESRTTDHESLTTNH